MKATAKPEVRNGAFPGGAVFPAASLRAGVEGQPAAGEEEIRGPRADMDPHQNKGKREEDGASGGQLSRTDRSGQGEEPAATLSPGKRRGKLF